MDTVMISSLNIWIGLPPLETWLYGQCKEVSKTDKYGQFSILITVHGWAHPAFGIELL
jgi:hypothetical protein